MAWAKPKATRRAGQPIFTLSPDDEDAMLQSYETRDKHGPTKARAQGDERKGDDVCIEYAGVHFFPQR
jgi:hypothetical protein